MALRVVGLKAKNNDYSISGEVRQFVEGVLTGRSIENFPLVSRVSSFSFCGVGLSESRTVVLWITQGPEVHIPQARSLKGFVEPRL